MAGILEFSKYFPSININTRSGRAITRLGIDQKKYMGMAVCVSGLGFWVLVAFLLQYGFQNAFIYGIVGFIAIFGFFLILPQIELKKKILEIESEMPFFLRSLGMLLEMRVPFNRAITIATGNCSALRKDMRNIISEIEKGAGIQRAFLAFASSIDSLLVKRAISQVISTYEIGSSGADVKRIGDEMLVLEQHKLKEYSAKSAMFGLMFIISSAILPTFFLVYAIAGKFALAQEVSTDTVMVAMLVIFPMISVLIITLSKASMPKSAFATSGGFNIMLLIPAAVFVLGFLIIPKMQIFTFIIGSAIAAYFIFSNYRQEKKTEEIEKSLPDALFSIAGMPRSTKLERIFEIIENGGYDALSNEAGKSRKQIIMNVQNKAVLHDLWYRNRSRTLEHVCNTMEQMINTNSLDKINVLAEDIVRNFQIRMERSQIFAMQKYTLIFGAFLIALILRMTIGLLQSMGDALGDSGIGEMIVFSESMIPAYLVIYATISSTAIADAEGKQSSLPFYFIMLAVFGLLTFFFIKL